MMGKIFAIKKYAIHDGPNIRTTIFLKGCPLRCLWCHNPEGIAPKAEVIWVEDRCVGCRECLAACPAGALDMDAAGIHRDGSLCAACGQCVDRCPALAQEQVGREMSVSEVMAEIKKDIPFYDRSGGGVTFSGGEPLLQESFLLALLGACRELNIHTAVDTSCFSSSDSVMRVAQQADLFLIDLKHMDRDKHQLFTGVDNSVILENITQLSERGSDIVIRIPLIDGFNSDESNLEATAGFLSRLDKVSRVDILPFHRIASAKYAKLGMEKEWMNLGTPTQEVIDRWVKAMHHIGIDTHVGG